MVKIIARYFIILGAIVSEIVLLISYMDCSLLVYRNSFFLCVDLYSVIFLNLFIG